MKKGCVVWIVLALYACTPGSGEGLDANGRPIGESPDAGSNPGASYQKIQDDIFTPTCTVCHAGAAAPLGLRLDAANSFAQLVSVASVEVPALLRVDPGDPDNSYLVQKLEGTAAVGERMPVGGAPVAPDLIALVRDWIAGGALPDPPPANPSAPPRVASVVPADGATLSAAPDALVAVFDTPMDASLFGAETVQLTASGGDGTFGDGNETDVTPTAIGAAAGNQVTLNVDLRGVALADDTYRLTLRGSGTLFLASLDGIALDGDGDGTAGGDFVSDFVLDTFMPPPPDTNAPQVSIAAPAGELQGTVTIRVAAVDDVGVTAVRLAADGQQIGALTASPYDFSWDTTTVANGDYTLTAAADDAAGNTGDAAPVTVTVNNPPAADVTAPTVALDALAATVAGDVTVSATASDDTGVTSVRFYVDAVLVATDTTAPYSFVWMTTSFAEGAHTLRAEAEDAAGNVGVSADVGVSVDNIPEADVTPPSVSVTAPASPASGSVNVTVSASDDVGVTAVRLFADGALVGTDLSAPFTFAWDTTAAADGDRTLSAEAEDAAGNVGTSAGVTVTVDNAAPTVAIDALASPLSGTVSVSLTAGDNLAVAAVRLFADGALVGTDTTAPYAIDWDTTAGADGDRVLRAEADDTAGNTGMSANVTVTVNNAPADTMAPSVDIQMPAGDLSGSATISVIASDDTAVTAVTLLLDGAVVATLTDAPYDFTVDTVAAGEGNHVLAAHADDAAANRGHATPIVVSVDNGVPQPTLPWIQDNVFSVNCTLGGCHDVGGDRAGLILVEGMSFVELVNAPTEDDGPPFRVLPNDPDNSALVQRLEGTITPQMPLVGGPLAPAIIAAVRDWIANGALEAPADTIAPAVTLRLPASPAAGTVSLTAEAVDDVAVTAVRFLVDGVEVGSAFSTPFVLSFDTTTVANGPAAVVALAEDAAGNTTQTEPQTLIVEN